VTVPIHVAYVEGRTPPWSDALLSGVADAFPNPIHAMSVPLDLAPYLVPSRQQHHALLVLAALLRHRPDAGAKILGVVAVDLFIPVLTFVFGQAQLDGPSAVVSTYRLRSEFYGLPANEGLLVDRAIKECVHELGHTFGLVHCPDYACVMHASTAVDEVDIKGSALCGRCTSALEERGRRCGAPALGRRASRVGMSAARPFHVTHRAG
jgi:archaemetzincin